MRPARRHSLLLLLLVLLAALVAGCGGNDGPAATTATTSTDDATTTSTVEEDDADGDDEAIEPTPAARAAGAGLDRLARAFAPVSARINFLVTAETLRADAIGGNAGAAVEQERAGIVRIELVRMQDVLRAARPQVASVQVRTAAQQQVQQLLLEAIDTRLRAMAQLRAVLQAEGNKLPDRVIEQRTDLYEATWDAALRATREATTVSQDARSVLGLAPAPEEALR